MTGVRGSCGPVLIVDDDGALRALVRELLEAEGYSTREAASGAGALASAAEQLPALVVLDVAMPSLSGYEVCRLLRARLGDAIPILFVSGDRTEPHDRVAGLLLGGDDYLVKPFAPEELVARVHALLRRRSALGGGRHERLTPRERQVLELLGDGLAQREIADRLVISGKTVGTHIERIISKLGVHSRAQAVAVAYRDGLLRISA
jgi:DNA-binding NarL/FixJ family response regulator